MSSFDRYVNVGGRRLRCGYTTGTCAAAASMAAFEKLLTGIDAPSVIVVLPDGSSIDIDIDSTTVSGDSVMCSVIKDGGDDEDATHGMTISSTVTLNDSEMISMDGGEGIGRVTIGGLDRPIGDAAINSTPRMMIEQSAKRVCSKYGYHKGAHILITAPRGREIAERTFNPRLGIVGGISILGTSGIVEPMSEKALVESIRIEINTRVYEGMDHLLIVPGNYGADFSESALGLNTQKAIKCSNFIGDTLDMCVASGIKGTLIVANLGKLIKVAGGIMNTHSRNSDCRMEIIASNYLAVGGDADTARRLLDANTTDDAFGMIVDDPMFGRMIDRIMSRAANYIVHRTYGRLDIALIGFSSKFGKLGEFGQVEEMMRRLGR